MSPWKFTLALGAMSLTIGLTACEGTSSEDIAQATGLDENEQTELLAQLKTYASSYLTEDLSVATLKNETSPIQSKIAEVFANTSGNLESCLSLIPVKPATQDPQCYGPVVDYEDHPDSSSKTDDGHLPLGDTGFMAATTSNGEACSAAKMDVEMKKLQYQVDMSKGVNAFVGCVMGYSKKTLPINVGDETNLVLDKLITDTKVSYKNEFMRLSKTLENNVSVNNTLLVGTFTANGENRSLALAARFTPPNDQGESRGGYNLIEKDQAGNITLSSIRFMTQNNQTFYRSLSGQIQPNTESTSIYAQLNAVYSDPSKFRALLTDTKLFDGNKEAIFSSDQPWNNIVAASAKDSAADLYMAYGWNAGGMDDYKRVFNMHLDKANQAGKALYGYVKNHEISGKQTTTAANLNINLLDNSVKSGMICNWAGPNNQHDPMANSTSQTDRPYYQYQSIQMVNNQWKPQTTNIKYVMTNSCKWDEDAPNTSKFSWTIDDNFSEILPSNGTADFDLIAKNSVNWWTFPLLPN